MKLGVVMKLEKVSEADAAKIMAARRQAAERRREQERRESEPPLLFDLPD